MMNYGMGMMGMGMTGGQNVFQMFKAQYGCEDCNRKEPYWTEWPKPVMPVPPEVVNPSFSSKIKKIMAGG